MGTWWKFENWFIFFWLIFLSLQTHTARDCPGGGQGGRGVRVWGREWRFRRRGGVCWCSRGAGGGKGREKKKRGSDHFVFSIADCVDNDAVKATCIRIRWRSMRVAGLGRLSAGAKMAMKPFVKRVFTIFATNASFLRVISNFRI